MEMINVMTGEMKDGNNGQTLVSNAIGSCVVVAVFDPINKRGAMAHIMLPGKAPSKPGTNKLRYAHDAIHTMLGELSALGTDSLKLVTCLVGGGNVLKTHDDRVCRDNIESVTDILNKLNLKVSATSLGGTHRRTTQLYTKTGKFYYTEGNSSNKLLFDAQK